MCKSTMALHLFYLMFLIFHLGITQGADSIIFEDDYTVSTVFDGDKSNLKVNPHSVQYYHHQYESPPSDRFVILDSVASTLYTVSLSTNSDDTVVQRLAGNGVVNYRDGDVGSAHFDRPKSFAVDYKGNVYVADQRNHAIRKINKSGVMTIAGGYTKRAGRTDGPGRNASFSDDFELTFVPERCALMVSDHGNRLIRQIKLKPEDCARKSKSVLGSTSTWILGLVLSCMLGLIIGLVIRPYIFPCEGSKPLRFSSTWTHYLMNLGRQVTMHCFAIKNAVVKSTAYNLSLRIIMLGLSHLSLMFRPLVVQSSKPREMTVSLLDLDEANYISSSSSANLTISSEVEYQLKDLLTFGGEQISPLHSNEVVEERESNICSLGKNDKIDDMLLSNLMNFEEHTSATPSTEFQECNLGLVKRK